MYTYTYTYMYTYTHIYIHIYVYILLFLLADLSGGRRHVGSTGKVACGSPRRVPLLTHIRSNLCKVAPTTHTFKQPLYALALMMHALSQLYF